ncbi:MAG: HDOD domain-containing protein, partial [Deltaproteobacteria bacterium]|nr:HDOD domain-containing protein [Deltaproteobacteria bacterium]
ALIEKDPSLAIRLLSLANSAFFRSAHPVSTLKQANIKVGFHRLRIMALSLSLRDTFPMGKIGPMDYEAFWRTSLYRALLSRSLAQAKRDCHPEEAFVAGLILDIGLLIFFDLYIKGKNEDVPFEPLLIEKSLAREREKYGIDHRQVGEAALRYWEFPESIIDCQKIYDDREVGEGVPALIRLCEVADDCSSILFDESRDFHSLFEHCERALGLDAESMNTILIDTFDQVEDIADNLRLELSKEKDLIDIMGKANHALAQISGKMSEYNETKNKFPSFENLDQEGEVVAHTLQAVAHEIRNPLMAVGGFAKKLADALDPSTDGGKYAQVILTEALRLEKALADMNRVK